jgi:hypothetical protein
MNRDIIILRNAVPPEICKFTAIEYEIFEEAYRALYPGQDPSDMCRNSFARYAPLPFETLSVYLQPLIEKEVGMNLYPTYSYARIYYNGSELSKHKDRQSSEITVSVCIEKDTTEWPLFIQNENEKTYSVNLSQGDLVIYSGKKHLHWREPFPGTKQIQAFLQYVDSQGESQHLKYDTRPALGLPFEFTDNIIKDELKRIASDKE